MKRVYQEIFDAGTGDCFSACLASLLELDIAEVPKFRRDNPAPLDMIDAAQAWLRDRFGLTLLRIRMTECDIAFYGVTPGTLCIASGVSPNLENCRHAIVGEIDKAGMNFKKLHDPNPSGKGIKGAPEMIYFLVSINPAMITKKWIQQN